MRLLVATGLKREARILSAPGVVAICSGGRSEALEATLAAEAQGGAIGIVSLGIAGALAPGLSPGDWVVAEEVLAYGDALPVDATWTAALAQRLPGARLGAFLGRGAMMTEAAEKLEAHAATGAIAVDMESHVAARLARRLGLRFAAARVVSDAANRSLPAAVKLGMAPDGGMALAPVLGALARDPAQVPALVRTGLEAERAFRALARAGPAAAAAIVANPG